MSTRINKKLTKQDILEVHKKAFVYGNFKGICEINKNNQIKKHIKLEKYLQLLHHNIYSGKFDGDTFEALFGGGAGGGKSFGFGYFFLLMSEVYPDTSYAIIRKELKQMRESTLITLQKIRKLLSFPEDMFKFNGQDNFLTFKNGSKIYFKPGKLNPSDSEYDNWGSTEFTGAWIEEGQQVPIQAKEAILTRTGRQNNDTYGIPAFLLITGNPGKNWMYAQFYKPFTKKELPYNRFFIPALVHDNPFIAKSYIKTLQSLPDTSTRKQRLYFGNWEYEDDPTALIDYESILSIFEIQGKTTGTKYLICDAARDGGDKITAFVFDGLQLIDFDFWTKEKTNVTAQRLARKAMLYGISSSRILVDANGIGGGVIDQLPEGVVEFVNNAKALNNENYRSLKDQCGYVLAEHIKAGKIGMGGANIPEQEQELITEELEWLRSFDDEKGGKARLLPKDKIKENIGRSPDFLDTLLMRMYFELKSKKSLIKEQIKDTNVNLCRFRPDKQKFVNASWYIGEDNQIAVWLWQTETSREVRVIDYLEEQTTTPADFMFSFRSLLQDNQYILNKNSIAWMKVNEVEMDPKADIYKLLKKLGLTSIKIEPKLAQGEGKFLVRTYFDEMLFLSPNCSYGYYQMIDDPECESLAGKALIPVIQAGLLREQDTYNVPINSMRDIQRLLHSDDPKMRRKGERMAKNKY
jgi:phage terminase large subunit